MGIRHKEKGYVTYGNGTLKWKAWRGITNPLDPGMGGFPPAGESNEAWKQKKQESKKTKNQ